MAPTLLALTASATGLAVTAAVTEDAELPTHAVAVLAIENEQTADRRIFDSAAFTWREPPLTLTLNHDPDQRIGAVTAIGRAASTDGLTVDTFAEHAGATGDLIVGLIEFDLGLGPTGTLENPDAAGRLAAMQVRDGYLAGVSVEYGNDAYEVECLEMDEDGFCIDYLMRWTAAEIGQVTLTGFQALDSARVIETSGSPSDEGAGQAADGEDAVAAAAGPSTRWTAPVPLVRRSNLTAAVATVREAPAAADFDDPGLTEPTPLTFDGHRVFGHAALWNTCHVGIADACVLAPRSPSGYAHFHTGELETDAGVLPIGLITMGTGHADVWEELGNGQRRALTAQETIRHYDDTGTQAAYVRAGEDEHGIWLAGIINPDLPEPQVRALRAAAPSGDWRRIGGALEMLAVLAVNTPGFPVPRTQGMTAGGFPVALVAAGVITRHGCGCGSGSSTSDLERRLTRVEATIRAAGVEDAAIAALAASVRPGP